MLNTPLFFLFSLGLLLLVPVTTFRRFGIRQPNKDLLPQMGCNNDCSEPECKSQCLGANSSSSCSGKSCKSLTAGAEAKSSCMAEECLSVCVGLIGDSECLGTNCKSVCTGFECKAKCSGKSCEAVCLGLSCEADCQGFNCTSVCRGLNCKANPPKENSQLRHGRYRENTGLMSQIYNRLKSMGLEDLANRRAVSVILI